MKFNIGKGHVPHLEGNKNKCRVTRWAILGSLILMSEKECGIVVDKKLNMSQQRDVTLEMTNAILSCIIRSIDSKSPEVLVPLYSALLRLHLKYCDHILKRMPTNWSKPIGGQQG